MDTLFAIGQKFPSFASEKQYKSTNKIDCGFKNLKELKVQLEISATLFQISKQRLEIVQPFTYSDDLSKNDVTRIIESYYQYFLKEDI